MGLKIVYSKFALQDLKEIYDYIMRDSFHYAKKEVGAIHLAIKKLKITPLLGKRFESSKDEFTREFISKNYRIIYDIVRMNISIFYPSTTTPASSAATPLLNLTNNRIFAP